MDGKKLPLRSLGIRSSTSPALVDKRRSRPPFRHVVRLALRVESFWNLVDEALEPDGRVFFFDDNHRTDVELAEGIYSPIVQRKLKDGTPFRVIKIPYQPAELERRLRALNWDITVTGTSGPFYWVPVVGNAWPRCRLTQGDNF